MTEPRKTPRSKQVAGLAATLERYAETYHACASNEADRWEAGRFLEAAKQLRALEAETRELAEALEDMLFYMPDDEMRENARAALASHRAKQEVGT